MIVGIGGFAGWEEDGFGDLGGFGEGDGGDDAAGGEVFTPFGGDLEGFGGV